MIDSDDTLIMTMTKANALRQEWQALAADFEADGRAAADIDRMNAIRAELRRLARRRIVGRARRELMFDLNGHHGQA